MIINGSEVINRIEMKSESGKYYVICELRDGSYSCSCPNWIFRRNKPNYQECKHIQEIKRQKANLIIQGVK